MNWWTLLAVVIGLLCGGFTYRIGFVRGFRVGEKAGATTVVNAINGLQDEPMIKDTGPPRHYDELEEHEETGGVMRPTEDMIDRQYEHAKGIDRYG